MEMINNTESIFFMALLKKEGLKKSRDCDEISIMLCKGYLSNLMWIDNRNSGKFEELNEVEIRF